jgi:ribosomal protein S18 acetylase RimI-like enzyme
MNIIEIKSYSDAVRDAINHLLPQMSASPEPFTEEKLLAIINSDTSHLLMTEIDGQYVGTLTLVVFEIPSEIRARIEDLIVHETARGAGVGTSLVQKAIKMAGALGAKAVDLTAHPSRKAANQLYKKLGFERRETNVYQRKIRGSTP